MKELTIQEKAKRYDEAIEIARKIANGEPIDVPDGTLIPVAIFPELAESKDEKIMREIRNFISWAIDRGSITKEQRKKTGSWFSWLEKQSQKEYTFKSLPRLLDMIEPTSRAKAYCQKLVDTLVKEGYSADAKIIGKCLKKMEGEDVPMAIMDEKQDKHKLSDKIEPKFHEGDWVVCEVTGSVYQIRNCIENLSNHKYGYDLTNDGYISTDEVNHYHLWDITKDAKDGDVLEIGNMIFIYKRTLASHIVSYCKLINDVFESWEDGRTCCEGNKYVQPATKEHHVALEKAMADAGFTFDFEKKELKKIKQNPTCTWSEEDEAHFDSILKRLEGMCKPGVNFIATRFEVSKDKDWLKSIKNRIGNFDGGYKVGFSAAKYNQWRPSNEQIKSLRWVIEYGNTTQTETLKGIYEQLKKLKGE